MVVNRNLDAKRDRDHEQSNPRAVRELRGQHDEQHDAGHHKADNVNGARAQDGHARLAGLARTQLPVPVLDHAQLRERKGNEDTNDVELDEARRLCLETNDECNCRNGENHDAVRIGQAVATAHHLVRQERVARQDRGQRRESVKRRISCENKDEAGHDGNQDEEDRSVSEHSRRNLRDRRVNRRFLRDRRALISQLARRVVADLHAGRAG